MYLAVSPRRKWIAWWLKVWIWIQGVLVNICVRYSLLAYSYMEMGFIVNIKWSDIQNLLCRVSNTCVHAFSAAQLCSTLCDATDCSLSGSSVHGIFPARILEWIAISSSRGSPQLRDQTHVSCTTRWIFHCWATGETLSNIWRVINKLAVINSQVRKVLCLECARKGPPVWPLVSFINCP